MPELATDDWIKERWGGFTYLILGRNEDFMLVYQRGNLVLHYERDDPKSDVSQITIMENATKQSVIDTEKLFGQGAHNA